MSLLTKENAQLILKRIYGYEKFRPGQDRIIESILEKKDTFAIMPTGAGKSLCYQIPALLFTQECSGLTLVISPLISLMKDQVDAVRSLGISAACINSSLRPKAVAETIDKAGQGEYDLLYIAPERLESDSFLPLIQRFTQEKTFPVSFVAIDEAHCVSQWGHDFRRSYRRIGPFIERVLSGQPSGRPVVAAFTATATEEVKADIVELLSLKDPKIYVTGFDRPNLEFTVVRGENKKDFLLDYLASKREESGIIYAATRKEVENVYRLLREKGYEVGKYHAGLKDTERQENQELFIYDRIKIMVATNAFGMGIDKSNVRFVIHYNLPKNMESYYQEAGRAGRDGDPGECTLLFSPQDILLQKYLIEQSVRAPKRKAHEYTKLQTMVDYAHTGKCLRGFILEYFGEKEAPAECGNCSNCNNYSEVIDLTVEAQKIFSCIVRMREQYGATIIAEVLRGSKNKKLLRLGLNRLTTYGALSEYTLVEIKDLLNQMVAEEYLRLTNGRFPVVKLLPKAVRVLKSEEKVLLKVFKKRQTTTDNSLFEVLRAVRRELAEQESVPPYIIFSDSTLREMASNRPVDHLSMQNIKGVGEVKLKKYGAVFIEAIRTYLDKMDNLIKPSY